MNIKKNILVVEDELIIADHIKENLEKMGYRVCGLAPDYASAVVYFNSETIDLALIDIQLEGNKSGIDLAMYIRQNFGNIPFIFLTSFIDNETITRAKETNPDGYLTKPFIYNSVYSTIEIALHNSKTRQKDEVITIPEGTRSIFIKRSDILYIESEHVYSHIFTINQKLLVRNSLSEIMKLLPEGRFARVHRSYIVNIEQIRQIASSYILVGSIKIQVGDAYKISVQSILNR